MAVWSSDRGFALRISSLVESLGYAAFVPGPGWRCSSSDIVVLDKHDSLLLYRLCRPAKSLIVDGARPLESLVAVVETLGKPHGYLVGLDPGKSLGLAVLASDTLVYGDVVTSVAVVKELLCRLRSSSSLPILVGVGSSPAAGDVAEELAAASRSCGLETIMVNEHGSNTELLPGLRGLPASTPSHLRAAAAIALRAAMQPG